ncbi:rab-GTPase-TBC domain-containing protein [Lipomyces oligophaga]|uniref:rab-GTPase-TBC domain-containing protein n=1 Tax=Lipomyces oligophaga TaxID=45792 RepID=UPI0034CFE66A
MTADFAESAGSDSESSRSTEVFAPRNIAEVPASSFITKKKGLIKDAVAGRDRDRLRRLAMSKGGLLTDELRAMAWPILLGCDLNLFYDSDWRSLQPHSDESQISLDTARAFVYYPENMSESFRKTSQQELNDLVVNVLRHHPDLSYFQGYHDVASVLYLVLGPQLAFPVLRHITLNQLRDFMMPDLDPSLAHLRLIPPLLQQLDKALSHQLRFTGPQYALASIITMYAHSIESYEDITLLYDFFFAVEDMSLQIYLFVVILISRREELLAFDPEDHEILEVKISQFPKIMSIKLSDALPRALALREQHPPETLLPEWNAISRYSVLKSVRPVYSATSLSKTDRTIPPLVEPKSDFKPLILQDDGFEHILMEGDQQMPDYSWVNYVTDLQLKESKKKMAKDASRREKEKDRRRLQESKRKSIIFALPFFGQSAGTTKSKLELKSNNISDLKKLKPELEVNALRALHLRHLKEMNSFSLAAFGMSLCLGLMSVWIALVWRRE